MKHNYFKLLMFTLLLLGYSARSNAQTVVTIGSGTSTSSYFPIYTCYGYNYSQQIYLGSEVAGGGWSGSGLITKIRFYLSATASTSANYNNWTVYLGNTTQNTFANTTNWIPASAMSSVFTGTVDLTSAGWKEITLSTPFLYTGGNLVVAVDENSPGYSCTVSWRSFSSTAGNRSLLYYSDGTNPNPASPPTANYGPNANLAQFQFEIDGGTPCSGTPAVAVAASSAPTACAGVPFTLSATGLPSGVSNITYQWQSRPAGSGTFTNITGATSATYNAAMQTAPTEYQLLVTCTSTGGGTSTSNTLLVGQNAPSECHCVPVTTGGTNYYITSFSTTGGLTNISNTSAGSTTGYQDFHLTAAGSAYQGATMNYSIMITGTSNYGRSIWIDYNEDGDFADSGEQVHVSSSYDYPPLTGSFTIPLETTPGSKRMRVVATYSPSNPSNPCLNSGEGEYEDYTINVLLQPACAGVPTPAMATAFSTVSVTGYNADIVANGIGLPAGSTTAAADAANFFFVSPDYKLTPTSAAPTYSLPANGLISVSGLPGLKFKIPAYTDSNSLRLSSSTPGTLALNTPARATALYLLATTGSGPGTISATVYFNDGSNQTFTGLTVADWYSGTTNVAMQGIGRVGNTGTLEGNSSNPRLYYIPLVLDATNYNKLVDSIVLTRTSTTGIVNIMGVSMQTPTPEHHPVCGNFSTVLNLVSLPSGFSGITYQWQESFSASGPFMDITGATTSSFTTPTLTANTYYRAKITCTNSGMSSYSDTVAATLLPAVPITAQPMDVNACDGAPVTLSVGAPAGTSYQWYMGSTAVSGANSSTLNISSAALTDAGTYSVLLNGCTSSDTVSLAVSPSFPVDLGNDTSICAGNLLTLDAGNPGATYNWSTGSTAASVAVSTAGSYSVAVTNGACTVSDTLVLSTAAYPVVNLGNDTAICTGDIITLDAGNAGATYVWSTGEITQTIATSTAGSYQVTVANGLCATQDTLVLAVNNYPVVDLGMDTSICTGASLTLDAGNPGATYNWSTGAGTQSISAMASGVYQVTVANGSCETMDAITVTVDTLPVVNLGSDSVICTGNTLNLDAGNPGSTYVWSTGENTQTIAVTAAGGYSVLVTNGACHSSDTIDISVTPMPVVALGADTSICSDATLMLDAGNTGASFTWSTGDTSQMISVTTAGTYSVIVGIGCVAADTIMIEEVPVPVAGTIEALNYSPDFEFSAAGTSSDVTYVWDFGDGTSATTKSAGHTYTDNGTYTVTLVVTNKCGQTESTTATVVVSGLDVHTVSGNASLVQVYPNPSSGLTVVEAKGATIKTLEVVDNLGRVVLRSQPDNAKASFDVKGMAQGIYTLRIQTTQGSSTVKLVVKD